MKPVKRIAGNLLTKKIPFSYKAILLYNHFTTDVYILSFPKSGRTWVRMILAGVFSRLQGKGDIRDLVEDAKYFYRDGKRLKATFEHEDSRGTTFHMLERNKNRYKNKKVVFLARDPRDVMVSYFFEMTKRKNLHFSNISEFIRNPAYGIDTLITYMNVWAENRHVPEDFLLLTYEALHRDTENQIRKLLHFIGIHDAGVHITRQAVAASRFENMHRLERSGKLNTPELIPADRNDQESYKTRKGRVGGYADYLPEEDIVFISKKIDEELSPFFGYTQTRQR